MNTKSINISSSKLKEQPSKPLSFKLKPIKWNQLSKEVQDIILSKTDEKSFQWLSDIIRNNSNILLEEDGLYQVKDNDVYPVSHPDLSTQPSILPQRYGNLPLYEILVANGRESDIPSSATIISASSFNSTACVPAICKKVNGAWTITNSENITPDFTLVRYFGSDNGYYYYYGDEESPEEYIRFNVSGGSDTVPGLNAVSVWGTSDPDIQVGQEVGILVGAGGYTYPITVENLGNSITLRTNFYYIYVPRDAGWTATLSSSLPFDTVLKFYK